MKIFAALFSRSSSKEKTKKEVRSKNKAKKTKQKKLTRNEKIVSDFFNLGASGQKTALDFFASPEVMVQFEDAPSITAAEYSEMVLMCAASFPDIQFNYASVREEKPGQVVVEKLRVGGTHTGAPFGGFGPNAPPVKASNLYCVNDPETTWLDLNAEGKFVKFQILMQGGGFGGPLGLYKQTSGQVPPRSQPNASANCSDTVSTHSRTSSSNKSSSKKKKKKRRDKTQPQLTPNEMIVKTLYDKLSDSTSTRDEILSYFATPHTAEIIRFEDMPSITPLQYIAVMESVWASFPDFKLGYQTLREDRSGLILLEPVEPSGTHTGEPFAFANFPPVPTCGKKVTCATERVWITLENGKITLMEIFALGAVTGPAGLYTLIGGKLEMPPEAPPEQQSAAPEGAPKPEMPQEDSAAPEAPAPEEAPPKTLPQAEVE